MLIGYVNEHLKRLNLLTVLKHHEKALLNHKILSQL
jgi:hypothetical protein